ncbi:MAG: hypothetical protein J4F34_05460 [Gemmatimonadetes bacterium]|nr:hypothetical protein [Gemmatimonadota bacterium]
MLPQCYPNYKTVHRRFQTSCRGWVLADFIQDLASELREAAIVYRYGLPLSVGTHSAQRHEAELVQLSLNLALIDELPDLVGDKAYDSDPLDTEVIGDNHQKGGRVRYVGWLSHVDGCRDVVPSTLTANACSNAPRREKPICETRLAQLDCVGLGLFRGRRGG